MIERGDIVEEITQVIGPVKRRSVFEEWRNSNLQVTATVPLFTHLVVRGEPGRRVICPLYAARGSVEVVERTPSLSPFTSKRGGRHGLREL